MAIQKKIETKKIYLRQGKEKAILNRHHWIFSGAIKSEDKKITDGEIISVCASDGTLLGSGYYNSSSQIRVRMLTFGEPFSEDTLGSLVKSSIHRRKNNPLLKNTNAYRMIYSESDLLPGLVTDNYNGHLVIQILTLGMEKLKDSIISILSEELNPLSIYERSDHAGRSAEGLNEFCGQIKGLTPDEVEIEESGIKFLVDIKNGQKTGFFLDQRDSRGLVEKISSGKTVLNLFSYTGGFSAAALKGGALSVKSVDASASALEMLKKNISINGFSGRSETAAADVFDYIRKNSIDEDIIILDPPSFVKSRDNLKSALKGYKDINLQIFKKAKKDSLLLTFSCSRFVDQQLFQQVVFSSLLDSKRNGFILQKGAYPGDHPVNLYHPELEYLKSLLIYIE